MRCGLCVYACIHIHVHIHIQIHIHIHVHIHIHMYIYTYLYIYIYAYEQMNKTIRAIHGLHKVCRGSRARGIERFRKAPRYTIPYLMLFLAKGGIQSCLPRRCAKRPS